MKRTIVSTILVLALLATAGIAYALWEETQHVQVTGRILPPEGMFQIVATACVDSLGYGHPGHCYIDVRNDSENIMRIKDMVVESSVEDVAITITPSVFGTEITPGGTGTLVWYYAPDPYVFVTGDILFDVEVTCEGDYRPGPGFP